MLSLLGVRWLIGFGISGGSHPPAPGWWPVDDKWWLVGGWGTGATLIVSGVVAGGMLVYSFVKLRGGEDPVPDRDDAAHQQA